MSALAPKETGKVVRKFHENRLFVSDAVAIQEETNKVIANQHSNIDIQGITLHHAWVSSSLVSCMHGTPAMFMKITRRSIPMSPRARLF